jgi:nucleotide-binding universal stress UspA family protein
MSVPAVRWVTVGVDGSAESVAALRWACREASLRGAQVHAVHVREAQCHSLASYAVPAQASPDDFSDDSIDDLVRSVQADQAPDVEVRVQVVDGLAARVLLERCEGADMLVLGTASDTPGAGRPLGPVIRACLRRATCPVVVISAAKDPAQRGEDPVRVPAGVGVPAAAGV